MVGAFLIMDVQVPPVVATALTDAGEPVPPSSSGVALVDTGATFTCVDEPILTGLGLHPVGTVASGTAAGPVQQSLYVARITFPIWAWTMDIQVVGVDLSGQILLTDPPQRPIALLGRNLLKFCVLIWNGPGGFWTITQ